jgi:CubicO group peptidase (beta-lactamase class C family)
MKEKNMRKGLALLIVISIAYILPACSKKSPPAAMTLDLKIEQTMKQWQIPGLAVVVVKDGETVLMRGYGTREAGRNLPINDKTYLQIASNSKTFTAYLFGMLVDEGKLKWDDLIKKYIPELKLPDSYVTENVAVDDLLCHRSGLTEIVPGGFQNRDYTFEALLEDIKTKELSIRFRSDNNYSQVGMAILGEVVNRATGQSWGENIRKKIFEPLGMRDSYTSNLDFEQRVGEPDTVENIMQPAIKKESVISLGTWESIGSEDLYAPAGGIISTMEDMAKWIEFRLDNGVHKGDQLISHEAIKEIRKTRIPTSFSRIGIPNSFIYPRVGLMGTGFGQYTFEHNGNKVIVHNGGWMNSVLEVIPQENLGVGLFSNANYSDLHPSESLAFVNAVALIVIDHYLGYDYLDWSSEMLEIVRKSN